jgi:hypothetical protein
VVKNEVQFVSFREAISREKQIDMKLVRMAEILAL